MAFYLIGHDMMITMTAETWQIGLSGFEQIIFYNFIDLIMTLANAVITLTNNCIIGITANEKRCKELLNASVGTTTAFCSYIGYKKAASLAKKGLKSGVPVKQHAIKMD